MLDNQLETFICIVESGSFSKAAELLYLSPTAIINRMNSLENQLDFKLFNRTFRGIDLTPSGEYFYTNCKELISELHEIVQNAKRKETSPNAVLRIGNSFGYPTLFTEFFLPQLSSLCKGIHFEFMHYPLNYDNIQKMIRGIGTDTDVVIDNYDPEYIKTATDGKIKDFPLFELEMACFLSTQDPLASHDSIYITDLYGKTVYIPQAKSPSLLKILIEELKQHPQIKIKTYNPFDFLTKPFNIEKIYINTETFPQYNPAFKQLPFHWNRHNYFGIMYKEDSPHQNNIRQLLQNAKKVCSISSNPAYTLCRS